MAEEEKANYISMIGTAQRLITLGRFDITIAMFKLSSYRVAPQKRHLEQMKRLYGYIKQFPMLLYIFVQTYLSKVKWYMSPMNGYTQSIDIFKKNCT